MVYPIDTFLLASNYKRHLRDIVQDRKDLDYLIRREGNDARNLRLLNFSARELQLDIDDLQNDIIKLKAVSKIRQDSEKISKLIGKGDILEILDNANEILNSSRQTLNSANDLISFQVKSNLNLKIFDSFHIGKIDSAEEFLKQGEYFLKFNLKEAKIMARLCFEKAAELFERKNLFENSFLTRKRLASIPLTKEPYLGDKFSSSENNSIKLSGFDGGAVKRGTIFLQNRIFEDEMNQLTLSLRLTKPSREKLNRTINAIKTNPKLFENSLPPEIRSKVSIQSIDNGYYGPSSLKKDALSKDMSKGGILMGKAIKINFEGIGSVILGDDPKFFSLVDRIEVSSDKKSPDVLNKMHGMLSMLGLGSVLDEESQFEEERKK